MFGNLPERPSNHRFCLRVYFLKINVSSSVEELDKFSHGIFLFFANVRYAVISGMLTSMVCPEGDGKPLAASLNSFLRSPYSEEMISLQPPLLGSTVSRRKNRRGRRHLHRSDPGIRDNKLLLMNQMT